MTGLVNAVQTASAGLPELEATQVVAPPPSTKANGVTPVSSRSGWESGDRYAREFFRAWIEGSGQSAAFWAKKADMDASTLSLYLSGKRALGRDSALRLCAAIGVDSRVPWPAPMAGVRS